MERHETILNFWFGNEEDISSRISELNQKWFNGGDKIDQEIYDLFKVDVKQAVREELESWENAPNSCLALIILLDQFSLNIHREKKQAFEQSLLAVPIVENSLQKNFDQKVMPIKRVFYYLPLEHAEDIKMQELSVELFTKLYKDAPNEDKKIFKNYLDYAIRHHDVIKKFERFPGRNEAMNRTSSQEEVEYLSKYGGF